MQVASDDGAIRLTRLENPPKAKMEGGTGPREKQPVPLKQRASLANPPIPAGMYSLTYVTCR